MSTDANEIDLMSEALVRALVKATAPTGDFIRAVYAAQTDAMIDMYSRFILAGWTAEAAERVVMAVLTNMSRAWSNVGQQMRKERGSG